MPIWKYKNAGETPPETLSDSIGFSDVLEFSDIKFLFDDVGFGDTTSVTVIPLLLFSLEDSVRFFDGFPEISFQLISLNNISGIVYFNDIIVETYTFDDIIGFDEDVLGDNFIPLYDSIGLSDDLSHLFISLNLLSDSSGFGETFSGSIESLSTLEDSFSLDDYPANTGFVITWRGRTKLPRLGYGGTGYGEVISYGEGYLTDISNYLFIVKNESETIVREEEITITNFDDPDQEYTYDWDKNETDNGTITLRLIFEVYQVDTYGNRSLVKIVNFCD